MPGGVDRFEVTVSIRHTLLEFGRALRIEEVNMGRGIPTKVFDKISRVERFLAGQNSNRTRRARRKTLQHLLHFSRSTILSSKMSGSSNSATKKSR